MRTTCGARARKWSASVSRSSASSLRGGSLVAWLQEFHDARRRASRIAVEWRLRVVFDTDLDRLRHGVACDATDEMQRHVDAGGDAGRRDDLAILDDALGARIGGELAQFLEPRPMRSRRPSFEQPGRA